MTSLNKTMVGGSSVMSQAKQDTKKAKMKMDEMKSRIEFMKR